MRVIQPKWICKFKGHDWLRLGDDTEQNDSMIITDFRNICLRCGKRYRYFLIMYFNGLMQKIKARM